jgi:hypothetical protein
MLIFAFAIAASSAGYASVEVDEEEVIFRLADPGASRVTLMGDFNNWNPTMDSMVRRGGYWEVRLYLVPGRYRYAFVVDGEASADPDNPNRDDAGNSFFIFVESDGVYDIVYEVTDSGERRIKEEYRPYGGAAAAAVEDHGLFTVSAGINGEIDGSIRGGFLIGAEYETTAPDPIKAYLVRARGEWSTEKLTMGAFHRSGRIGFDDPLSLFTDVGPYAYPLDLFCRGAEASAGWKGSAEGRIFFANRIDGYRSGLEMDEGSWPPMSDGDPEDRDMIGLSLKGSIGPVLMRYMYRHDRGPDIDNWYCDGCWIEDGHETRESHGLLVELAKKDYPVLRAQYLSGRTRLNADTVLMPVPPGTGASTSDHDHDWEDGYRALADLSWARGPFSCMIGWSRTSINRNPEVMWQPGWKGAVTDMFDGRAAWETDALKLDIGLELEDFSGEGGSGSTFWLQRENFWLDGDRLRTDMLQFLDSKGVWKAMLRVEENGAEELAGPYRLEGYLSASMRWDGDTESRIFEITGGKGIRAGSLISFHADLRYADYRSVCWTGDSGFFDAWLGARGSLGSGGWAALGVGVPPHRFDRWYYDFTGDGREHYLLEQGIFESAGSSPQCELIDLLGKAEKSLSEEWRLSFEAGFSF